MSTGLATPFRNFSVVFCACQGKQQQAPGRQVLQSSFV